MESVALARIGGRFDMIHRKVKPFIQVGTAVLDAIRENRLVDAQRLSLGFAAFEQAFGPDLARDPYGYQPIDAGSSLAAQSHQTRVLVLGVAMFCLAALSDLACSGC